MSDLAATALERLVDSKSKGHDVRASLQTLQKMLFNVLGDPTEQKFRRVRTSNPAVQSKLVNVPGALDVLRSFGFKQDGEFFVLDGEFDETVAALVTEILAAVEDVEARENAEAKRSDFSAALKQRELARMERERLVALARKEQAERRGNEADKPLAGSRAIERSFGSRATTFKDVGVDLNACKSG